MDKKQRNRKRRNMKEERGKRRRFSRTALWGGTVLAALVLSAGGNRILGAIEEHRLMEARNESFAGAPPFDVELLDMNEYSRPGIPLEQINGIVIHYTANPGSTAQNNRDYFNGLKDSHETKVSSHFVVGIQGEIIQCIPSSEIAYASNSRNADTLSIECCHTDETGKFTEATYTSLVRLTGFHPNIKSMRLIHIAFPLKNVYTYQNMEYIMLVSFDTQALSSFLDQMNQGQEEYIQAYIEDENGEIILHTSGTEYIGMSSEEYLNEHGLTDLTAGIESYGWTLHTVINENILRGEVDAMYGRMVILYLIAIVLILLILFWVTNRILRPVNIISNSIKRVEDGETREQIALEGTNEVWQLAREYNLMLQKIRKASQKVEEQHIQVILRFPFC